MHLPTLSAFFHGLARAVGAQAPLGEPAQAPLGEPAQATREFWMRRAVETLKQTGSPCPFAAFATVIVNHTAGGGPARGALVCAGVNSVGATGDPTQHGEVAALRACVRDLQRPERGLTPAEARLALRGLSLYTTAEPCPMCAAAARWAGLREVVFGTSVPRLAALGWAQMDVRAAEVFARSRGLGDPTGLVAGVLAEETDAYFAWQFGAGEPVCPPGCRGVREGCEAV